MCGLTAKDLRQICQTFLTLAYPGGLAAVPEPRRAFATMAETADLHAVLVPPLCQTLHAQDGSIRGYAIRLGSAGYPHLKLRMDRLDDVPDVWIFAVDTHDTIRLEASHPDASGWSRLRAANRHLKDTIEKTWEEQGVLTFNGLLRMELEKAPKERPG